MARAAFTDDLRTLASFAAVASVGYVLLKPRTDGSSFAQRLGDFLGGAVDSLEGTPAGEPFSGSSGFTWPQFGAPNDGENRFNINTSDTQVLRISSEDRYAAHVGVGHVGSGGSFIVIVDIRNGGFFADVGAGQWQELGRAAFSTAADGDWTGYGVDIRRYGLPAGVNAIGWSGLQARIRILGFGGETYTQHQEPVIPTWAGA
jgi:hypothetical protein